MIKILLDTNFLVLPFELKVDIFSEFERIIDEPFKVYTLSTCLGEVKKVRGWEKREKEAKAMGRVVPIIYSIGELKNLI